MYIKKVFLGDDITFKREKNLETGSWVIDSNRFNKLNLFNNIIIKKPTTIKTRKRQWLIKKNEHLSIL